MNKETRKFILGLLISPVCALATAHNLHNIINEFNWVQLVAGLICSWGLWIGIGYIQSSIKNE